MKYILTADCFKSTVRSPKTEKYKMYVWHIIVIESETRY